MNVQKDKTIEQLRSEMVMRAIYTHYFTWYCFLSLPQGV